MSNVKDSAREGRAGAGRNICPCRDAEGRFIQITLQFKFDHDACPTVGSEFEMHLSSLTTCCYCVCVGGGGEGGEGGEGEPWSSGASSAETLTRSPS
jgi:hypothetical protein